METTRTINAHILASNWDLQKGSSAFYYGRMGG